MLKLFLAAVIHIIHILMLLFMILAPFQNNILFLLLHTQAAITIGIHWLFNNNICCLSILEQKLRGVKWNKGFIHRIVSPVYDMACSDSKLINILSYTFLIGLGSLSLLKIYYNFNWNKFYNDYKQTNSLFKAISFL